MKTLPTLDDLSSKLANELAQLELFNDSDLWQVAQTTLSKEEAAQMQTLVCKQQRDGLTVSEKMQAKRLLQRYNRTMLVRAKAAVLLKERGFDISALNSPHAR